MKKEGIVIKLDGMYLEVLMLETLNCNKFENDVTRETQVHDCSSCSGCSSFNSTRFKTIRVLNKNGKNIKVGDRIRYSFTFPLLEFFTIVLFPILAFGLTFISFYFYSYSEQVCILFSFLVFLLVIALNSIFTKKLFIPFI